MTEVRVTTGSSGRLVHVVREGSKPPESRCGRAYAGPQEHMMKLERWRSLPNACRSCERSLAADKATEE